MILFFVIDYGLLVRIFEVNKVLPIGRDVVTTSASCLGLLGACGLCRSHCWLVARYCLLGMLAACEWSHAYLVKGRPL